MFGFITHHNIERGSFIKGHDFKYICKPTKGYNPVLQVHTVWPDGRKQVRQNTIIERP
jgi:hypothetical protein